MCNLITYQFDGIEDATTDFHCIGIIAQGPGGEQDLYFTLVYEWNEKGTAKGSAEHEELKQGNHDPKDYVLAFIEHARKLVKNGEL